MACVPDASTRRIRTSSIYEPDRGTGASQLIDGDTGSLGPFDPSVDRCAEPGCVGCTTDADPRADARLSDIGADPPPDVDRVPAGSVHPPLEGRHAAIVAHVTHAPLTPIPPPDGAGDG